MSWVVLLSEWLRLEEVGEKWGWEECPDRAYDGCNHRGCAICHGTGKIRSAWAIPDEEGEKA